ncbi:hypothetical protein [Kribbella albertanoniae]|uniref:Uncharacterized protein n=1 Tax=Kribbella albertanoniae TaxID=1266829 RepID=A0A4R4PKW6_9ACTN|nr:hypothetical protein [Kribbella albertanoniae]TDC22747.1 hypothetical protein E1261_30130 [Kribbella albertanoniae]
MNRQTARKHCQDPQSRAEARTQAGLGDVVAVDVLGQLTPPEQGDVCGVDQQRAGEGQGGCGDVDAAAVGGCP